MIWTEKITMTRLILTRMSEAVMLTTMILITLTSIWMTWTQRIMIQKVMMTVVMETLEFLILMRGTCYGMLRQGMLMTGSPLKDHPLEAFVLDKVFGVTTTTITLLRWQPKMPETKLTPRSLRAILSLSDKVTNVTMHYVQMNK